MSLLARPTQTIFIENIKEKYKGKMKAYLDTLSSNLLVS
jgi:hypothetical protein